MNLSDRNRFSAIAHRHFAHCNPLPATKIDEIIDRVEVPNAARALDLGCAKAEVLIRLVEDHGVVGVGVDRSEPFVAQARERMAGRVPENALQIHCQDASAFAVEPGSYDMCVCIGVSELFGDHVRTLRQIRSYTRSGGLILFGTIYWRRDPSPEYLELLGVERDWRDDYRGTVTRALDEGLEPVYARVASEDDWDHYEWLYRGTMWEYLRNHPEEPCRMEFEEHNRRGLEMFLGGGRDCLGFGLFLYRR